MASGTPSTMKIKIAALSLIASILLLLPSCGDNNSESPFTGNEVTFQLIPGEVSGIQTTGTMTIKERTGGDAQIDITLNGVLNGATHPVHLHFGSLDDDGLVATYLSEIREEDGIGKSATILQELDDNTRITYTNLLAFDGSIKIHFEENGPLEDSILGAVNIGINAADNAAYLNGSKSIVNCNNDWVKPEN